MGIVELICETPVKNVKLMFEMLKFALFLMWKPKILRVAFVERRRRSLSSERCRQSF